MTRFAAIIGILTVLAVGVSGGEGDGGYGGPWLDVPAGARPTAMGGTYLAISDDGAAPLFNPAGLAKLQRSMVSSSYRTMSMGRQLGYLTAVTPVRGQSCLGVHWLYAGSGSVEARDSDGYLTGHDIDMNSHQLAIIFAKSFEQYFSIGVNINYLISRISELSASTVGFDFGAMLYVEQLFDREDRDRLPVRDIQIGITAKNFSKEIRWTSEKYDLLYTTDDFPAAQKDKVPIELGLGVSARWLDRKLLTAVDVYKNDKQDVRFHTGAEYFVKPEFMLRAGLADGSLTAGTGYIFGMGKRSLAIDYAFSTDRVGEGSEHIFSFDLLF
jgi:hypothetical protein